MNQGKAGLDQSGGAITGRKEPSILKPSGPSEKESSGGTIGIISKPKIDPKKEPSVPQPPPQPEQTTD